MIWTAPEIINQKFLAIFHVKVIAQNKAKMYLFHNLKIICFSPF